MTGIEIKKMPATITIGHAQTMTVAIENKCGGKLVDFA